MANQYPYPEAEHYVFPKTSTEVIADELRHYPDGPSFRKNLVGLGRMYEKTPLLQCCKKYAALMQLAAVATGQTGKPRQLEMDFYAGEVFSLHANITTLDTPAKRILLMKDALEEYADGSIQYDPKDDRLQRRIDDLITFRDEAADKLFENQSERVQEHILEAALRSYDDVAHAGQRQNRFIAGYLFAAQLIVAYYVAESE